MIKKLRQLFAMTAFRLTAVYTILFGLMAVGVIIYVSAGAVDLLKRQVAGSINEELSELADIYEQDGINAAVRTLELRSRAPGANLYIIASPAGQILVGNVFDLDSGVLGHDGWTLRPFKYKRFGDREDQIHRAVARVVPMPNGMRLLIGRDIGEPEHFRGLIFNSLAFAMGSMLLLGFLAWFFVGRRALKRIDKVSKSTDRILAGSKVERLPVSGSGDEFDRLSLRLNSMLDRINVMDEGLKQVSDNIAHDLKTPLTRIRNTVERGLSLNEKGAQREALEKVLEESETLIKTFNALLMISRVEAGSSTASMEELDVSAILADIAELFEPAAEEEGFELATEIASDLKLSGNRELLSQAVSNLIDNAIKYGHGEKDNKIILGASNGKEVVQIYVADKGQGIAENDRERVLERFYRLEESRNKPGSGLGMSLVNAVANLHGGQLHLLDNEPGLLAKLVIPIKSHDPR